MKIKEEIKSTFESIHQKVGIYIIYTSNWLADKMNAVFKDFDVTAQQYAALLRSAGWSHDPGLTDSQKTVTI